jgi:hypothetical protein
MPAKPIEELLAETDAQLPPPRTSESMLQRIADRAGRQRRYQIALATVASMAIAATVLYLTQPRPALVRKQMPTHLASDLDPSRAQLAALDAAAIQHQKIAEDLMAAEQQAEALRNLELQSILAPDPLSYLDQARDRAARIMLMEADRAAAEPDGTGLAREIYRRASQLFPEAAAAREASARLSSLGA